MSTSAFDVTTCILRGNCTTEKLTTLTDVGFQTMEVLYHKSCHSRFVNGLSPVLGETVSGRPLCTAAMKAFDDMCLTWRDIV